MDFIPINQLSLNSSSTQNLVTTRTGSGLLKKKIAVTFWLSAFLILLKGEELHAKT